MNGPIPTITTAPAGGAGGQSVPVEVKSLPPELLTTNRAVTVRGEVTQTARDGTVRIQTPQGEVQVKITPPPQQGQTVELRITPPPKAPPQPQNQPQVQTQPNLPQNQPQPQPIPVVTAKLGVTLTPQNPSQTPIQAQQTTSFSNLQAFTQGPAKLLQTATQAVKSLMPGPAPTQNTPTTPSTTTAPLIPGQAGETPVQARPLQIGANLRLLSPSLQTGSSPFLTQPQTTQTLTSAPVGTQNSPNTARPVLTATLTPPAPTLGVLQNLPATTLSQSATPTPHLDVQVTAIQKTPTQTATPSPLATTPLSTPTPATPPPPGQFLAQVLGFTAQSLPVLSANLTPGQMPQTMTLQFPVNNLGVGDLVTLRPTGQILPIQAAITRPAPAVMQAMNLAPAGAQTTQPQGSITTPQAVTPLFSGMAGAWPALEEALEQLSQTLPPEQGTTLKQTIPQPLAGAPRLDAPAMLFIAALRNGDLLSWLGDKNARQLQAIGKSELLSRLIQDMAQMGARSVEPAPVSSAGGDWRSVSLPMLFGADLTRMQLFVQDEGADKEKLDTDGYKKDWIRFVMNADLSRIGPLQLDGIHSEARQSLDLLIKTHQDIGPDMRKTMRARYTSLMGGMDMAGTLEFKTDPAQKAWVQF